VQSIISRYKILAVNDWIFYHLYLGDLYPMSDMTLVWERVFLIMATGGEVVTREDISTARFSIIGVPLPAAVTQPKDIKAVQSNLLRKLILKDFPKIKGANPMGSSPAAPDNETTQELPGFSRRPETYASCLMYDNKDSEVFVVNDRHINMILKMVNGYLSEVGLELKKPTTQDSPDKSSRVWVDSKCSSKGSLNPLKQRLSWLNPKKEKVFGNAYGNGNLVLGNIKSDDSYDMMSCFPRQTRQTVVSGAATDLCEYEISQTALDFNRKCGREGNLEGNLEESKEILDDFLQTCMLQIRTWVADGCFTFKGLAITPSTPSSNSNSRMRSQSQSQSRNVIATCRDHVSVLRSAKLQAEQEDTATLLTIGDVNQNKMAHQLGIKKQLKSSDSNIHAEVSAVVDKRAKALCYVQDGLGVPQVLHILTWRSLHHPNGQVNDAGLTLLAQVEAQQKKLLNHEIFRLNAVRQFEGKDGKKRSDYELDNELWEAKVPGGNYKTLDEQTFPLLTAQHPELIKEFYIFKDAIYGFADEQRKVSAEIERVMAGGNSLPLNRDCVFHYLMNKLDLLAGSRQYMVVRDLMSDLSEEMLNKSRGTTEVRPGAGTGEEDFCQVFLMSLLVKYGILQASDINWLRIMSSDVSVGALRVLLKTYNEVIKSNPAYNDDALTATLGKTWVHILPILANATALGTPDEDKVLEGMKEDFLEMSLEDFTKFGPPCALTHTLAYGPRFILKSLELALQCDHIWFFTSNQSNLEHVLTNTEYNTIMARDPAHRPSSFLLALTSVDPDGQPVTEPRNMYAMRFGHWQVRQVGPMTKRLVYEEWSADKRMNISK
jgi:hypothetical protein